MCSKDSIKTKRAGRNQGPGERTSSFGKSYSSEELPGRAKVIIQYWPVKSRCKRFVLNFKSRLFALGATRFGAIVSVIPCLC